MPNVTPNILVIDEEYLIALDAERILKENLDCNVSFGTYRDISDLSLTKFNVAVIDTGSPSTSLQLFTKQLLTDGTRIILTACEAIDKSAGFPCLFKPYSPDDLLKHVINALYPD